MPELSAGHYRDIGPPARRRYARRVRVLVGAILVGSLSLTACDACQCNGEKRKTSRQTSSKNERTQEEEEECSASSDCSDNDNDPCIVPTCEDGRCVTTLSAPGTSCDNGNACDGVEKCDKEGRCVPGSVSATDDGNPCTLDSCDPAAGVRHEPVPVDDGDACTEDICNPQTGTITHTSVAIDDGDTCTIDSCDPRTGVKHQQPDPFYSCQPSCGKGFHPATRTPSPECGSAPAMRTYCMPNCGDSFYTCEPACPDGYHSSSRVLNTQCGSSMPQPFCQKNTGESFYTCDASCPSGYDKRSESKGGQCGPGAERILFCVRS